MEYWQAFKSFEYASEVLIIVGAMLVLLGTMKILGSSLKLLFWVLIVGIGVTSAMYGLNDLSFDFSEQGAPVDLSSILEPGKELSAEMLEKLCAQTCPR